MNGPPPKVLPKGGDAQRGQQFAQHSPFRRTRPQPMDLRAQAIDSVLGGAAYPGFFQKINRQGRRGK